MMFYTCFLSLNFIKYVFIAFKSGFIGNLFK